MELIESIGSSTVRLTATILLAALGGQLSAATGDLDISLEGKMLVGAFAAIAGSFFLGSTAAGVASAILAAVAMALLMSLFIVPLKANVFAVGIILNIFAAGLTVFLLSTFFGVKGSFSDPNITRVPVVRIPWIESTPILGRILSGHNILVYVAIAAVPLVAYLLHRTKLGLYLRVAGQRPEALSTAGISVGRLRVLAQIGCGALCGLAGAHLALGHLALFSEGMSAGRGFLALAVVMFVGVRTLGVAGVALLFGFAEAVAIRGQGIGLPSQFPEMLPYVVTLIALIYVSLKRRRSALLEVTWP